MAPLRRGVCRGTLPLTIVTAGFGHLDSNRRFQPQFQLGLPILASGLGSAGPDPLTPSFSLGKRTFLDFQPQLCQETVKGRPAGLAGRTPAGGKALCIRLHDKRI